ncbi:MAG TPA: peptidase M28, partial [Thermoanaerobaculia bacterium]|nr:peptidase M28 [Thermoanaerobaculia bacterium]
MHRRFSRSLPVFVIAALLLPGGASPAWAESVDLEMVTRIREEGFRNSQAVAVASHLTNVIGPRLTGSPAMKDANEWTRKKLTEWGLANARLEPYEFGRGWSFTRSAVHMVRPHPVPLNALPKAWTPGTDGPVRGLALRVDLDTEADMDRYRGKLAGKILFLEGLKVPTFREEPRRFSEDDLAKLADYEIPEQEEGNRDYSRRFGMRKKIREFLVQEKVAATVDPSSRGLNVVRVGSGGSYRPGENPGVPALMMAVE